MTEKSTFEQKQKYWEQLRNAIVHEDNLINHRLTWLLTSEWFVLSGFAIIQAAVLSNKLTLWMILGTELLLLMPIFMGMIWLCIISGSMSMAALQQIQLIRYVWIQRYPEEQRESLPLPRWIWGEEYQPNHVTLNEKPAQFPPTIVGAFHYFSKWRSIQHVPIVLLIVNLIIILACFGISAVFIYNQCFAYSQ